MRPGSGTTILQLWGARNLRVSQYSETGKAGKWGENFSCNISEPLGPMRVETQSFWNIWDNFCCSFLKPIKLRFYIMCNSEHSTDTFYHSGMCLSITAAQRQKIAPPTPMSYPSSLFLYLQNYAFNFLVCPTQVQNLYLLVHKAIFRWLLIFTAILHLPITLVQISAWYPGLNIYLFYEIEIGVIFVAYLLNAKSPVTHIWSSSFWTYRRHTYRNEES